METNEKAEALFNTIPNNRDMQDLRPEVWKDKSATLVRQWMNYIESLDLRNYTEIVRRQLLNTDFACYMRFMCELYNNVREEQVRLE
tara:strand:+ start:300 stop:560 length:261 start_codon:yes stop_codon:yes gene_type:complete